MPRPSWSRRGFDVERELVHKLWNHGFAVVRGPASGARAQRLFYPDVLAVYKGKIFVFEVKYVNKSKKIVIPIQKLNRLREFAERAGGTSLIAVKISGRGWRVVPTGELAKGNGKHTRNLVLHVEDLEQFPTLDQFISSVVNAKLVDFVAQ
jgi:Holliday junction resolvase